jgi:hypothetical protein
MFLSARNPHVSFTRRSDSINSSPVKSEKVSSDGAVRSQPCVCGEYTFVVKELQVMYKYATALL